MKKSRMIFCLLLAVMLCPLGLPHAGAEGEAITVKSYPQLLEAVNETKADEVIIAKGFKHGNKDDSLLFLEEGRQVVIRSFDPEKDALIDGSVYVEGPGSLVFERVNIKGSPSEPGLFAMSGTQVTACSVSGGDAKKGSAGAGLMVDGATVTLQSAAGGDCATGMGGDGVYALRNSQVTVQNAQGGAATAGYGGAGAAAMANCVITVTGEAAGGAGALEPGKAALQGYKGTVSVTGTSRDGETLPSKAKADAAGAIMSFAALQAALRRGETDILLSTKYSAGETVFQTVLFIPEGGQVKLTGEAGKKNVRFNSSLFVYCGQVEASGIDFFSDRETAVSATGEAMVTVSGNATSGKKNALFANGQGRIVFSGTAASKGSFTAVAAIGASRIDITGEAIGASGNALYATDEAVVTLTGDAFSATNKTTAAFAENGGKIIITGNASAPKGGALLAHQNGQVILSGNAESKSKFACAYAANGGEITITGVVTGGNSNSLHAAAEGRITLTGDVIVKSQYPAVWAEQGGEVEVTGNVSNSGGHAIGVRGGMVTVEGDVSAGKSAGLWASSQGKITIRGNAPEVRITEEGGVIVVE